MRLPQSIEELGLTSDADERAVKRAYAQRLKKIDQEADPDGFQHLRETYEDALRWVAGRDARQPVSVGATVSADPLPDSGPASALPAEPFTEAPFGADLQTEPHTEPQTAAQRVEPSAASTSPEQLASAVFNELMGALPEWTNRLEDARAMLQRGLDDVRLINLDARSVFEWLIGRQLLEGWRPGHEVLFVAALELFQWETDRNRLRAFGQVGATLDAALTERMVFHSQPEEMQAHYRAMINQLRQDGHPGDAFLSHNMELVEMLVARLPNWLWIITKLENMNRWREWGKAVARKSPPALASSRAASPPGRPQFNMQGVFAVMLVLLLLQLGNSAFKHQPEPSMMSTRAMEMEQERITRLMREVQERERKPASVESKQDDMPEKAGAVDEDARPALGDLKLTVPSYNMNLAEDIKASRTKSRSSTSNELRRAGADVAPKMPQAAPSAADIERRTFNEALKGNMLDGQLPTLAPKP